MHVSGHHRGGPSWLAGVAIFVGLVVILQLCRGQTTGRHSLEQQFAAEPPAPGTGQVTLPPLPSNVAGLAQTALARIGGGATGVALTPVVQQGSLRVAIDGISKAQGGLHITGSVANTGQTALPVSLAAFRFTDGSGTEYTASGSAVTTLAPGQRAPLDLTLPIVDAHQLVLDIQLEGQPPIHMLLLQTAS